jgi:hypothetical protein
MCNPVVILVQNVYNLVRDQPQNMYKELEPNPVMQIPVVQPCVILM